MYLFIHKSTPQCHEAVNRDKIHAGIKVIRRCQPLIFIPLHDPPMSLGDRLLPPALYLSDALVEHMPWEGRSLLDDPAKRLL